jgi:hypothetical protein
MLTNLLAVTTVTTGWKWIAVLIGLGVLLLLYLVVGLTSGWNPLKLVQGADGPSSTSKFQWLVWLVVILFSYSTLWVLKAKQGDWTAITDVPNHVLTVLGLSTVTMAAAKGITYGYTVSGRSTTKSALTPAPGSAAAVGNASATTPTVTASPTGGLTQDDNGAPDLSKIQMLGFTFVAVGIFIASVVHQIASTPPITALPDIDTSLLVLMGLSQGGYVAKKIVSP